MSDVVVIGGSNLDIVGKSNKNIIKRDSNIGSINFSYGGVARNISENINKLGINVKFVTILGDDNNGHLIYNYMEEIGVDMSCSTFSKTYSTSSYMAILDENNDMLYAINDMGISEQLDSNSFNFDIDSEYILIDTNISEELIDFIFDKYKNYKIIVDPVSNKKALKIKKHIKDIYLLKPNIYELEELSGESIKDENDLIRVASKFIDLGLKNLIVSLGDKGSYYFCKNYYKKYPIIKVNVKNATGAGDSFVAGIVYSLINNYSVDEMMKFSSACASLTLMSKDTINKDFSVENVKKLIERDTYL